MSFKEKLDRTPDRSSILAGLLKPGPRLYNIQTIHINLGEPFEIKFFDQQLNEEIYLTLLDLVNYLKSISWPNGIYIISKNQIPYLKVNIGSVKSGQTQIIDISEFESKLQPKKSWFWFW